MKHIAPELNYRNAGRIPDPTAYAAFSHEKEREIQDLEMAKIKELMKDVKATVYAAGFTLAGRVALKSRKSGYIYE